MSKLRLKETPEERERRKAKEERKAARRKQKRGPDLLFNYENDVGGRKWMLSEPIVYRTPQDVGLSYDIEENGPTASPSHAKSSQDYQRSDSHGRIRQELEEANFRAKLFDAMGDDERLDSIEARFNAYHVPDRWKTPEASNNPMEHFHGDI